MSLSSIAVVIACHNRRAKTLACLAALWAQAHSANLHVVLFDDGSTDGTADDVRRLYPDVEILAGDGTAFWAGGMRAAFDHALRRDADYYLWLNDDVALAPTAIVQLLTTAATLGDAGHRLKVVGGSVADPASGTPAYGGIDRRSRLNPLRFKRAALATATPQACDTLNGNVVLVPRATALLLGSVDPAFVHTLGDLDYGLRAGRAGAWVGVAPGIVGTCAPNTKPARWFNPDLPLAARWRLLRDPLGFPLRPWLHFARRHGGPFWFLWAPGPFWRLLVPVWLTRRVATHRSLQTHAQ